MDDLSFGLSLAGGWMVGLGTVRRGGGENTAQSGDHFVCVSYPSASLEVSRVGNFLVKA